MEDTARELERLVQSLYDEYSALEDEFCSIQLCDDKWSLKEIFGHLIDSAANNYQRFMRLQKTDLTGFPGYGTDWVKMVPYNSYPLSPLMTLWKEYNMLLVHIIRNLPHPLPGHVWVTEEERLSLAFLVKDYVSHMKLHAAHLEERVKELKEST